MAVAFDFGKGRHLSPFLSILVKTRTTLTTIAVTMLGLLTGQAGIKVSITVGTAKQALGVYRARQHDIYLGAWGPDYPDPNTNAATFAVNRDNRDEAGLTGQLAWRNAWDIPKMSEDTLAVGIERKSDCCRPFPISEATATYLVTTQ